MFVVSLTYQKPMEEVENLIAAHRDFLDRNYELGIFLASGPKNPRVGGVILASSKVSREQLEEILSEDPFHVHALARYEVTEFTPSKFAQPLEGIL
jgi:uncharacterized protein YciI